MTKSEIKNLAILSKLEFDEKGLEQIGAELENMIKFVSQVQKCDTSKQCVSTVKLSLKDLREDTIKPSLQVTEVLMNAANKNDVAFVVPKVVD